MSEEASYRFGLLERRGLIAGWRGGQIASVAGALLLAVLVLHARPDLAGAGVAAVAVAVGVALACWPVAGRTGEEWLPTVVRWTADGVGKGRRALSPLPKAGYRSDGAGHGARDGAGDGDRRGAGPRAAAPGGIFAGLSVLGVWPGTAPGDGSDGGPVGVFKDGRARTYTAALRVRGHSFALLGPADKERRISGWSTVLASLARERSLVHRLQWIATTLPDDGRGVRAHLAERAVLGPGDRAYRSYEELLHSAGSSASRHEVLVAIQIRVGRATQRAVRAAGSGETGAVAVLLREIETLRRQLGEADMVVEGLLGPAELARVVRRTAEVGPVDRAAANGHRPPGPSSWPWPMAVEVGWSSLRTDETWQATYWIAEWPRVDVGPDFLSPILLGPVRRSVAVVMEPLSPGRATRQVEQARTADVADSELRRRSGFLPTARRAREQELVTRREAELADGHASFRYSGYVTVTAPSPETLEDACEATEQAAGQARLELRRLFGDQARGFTCSLPLCRGLS